MAENIFYEKIMVQHVPHKFKQQLQTNMSLTQHSYQLGSKVCRFVQPATSSNTLSHEKLNIGIFIYIYIYIIRSMA